MDWISFVHELSWVVKKNIFLSLALFQNYTQYIPLSIYDLQTWMGSPSIFVYDCSNAGIIVKSFKQFALQREQELEVCNILQTQTHTHSYAQRHGQMLQWCVINIRENHKAWKYKNTQSRDLFKMIHIWTFNVLMCFRCFSSQP